MKLSNKAKTTSVSSEKTSPTSAAPLHANKRLLIDADNVMLCLGSELILDDISLCIHQGEFIGLIGPNGAGKSTLLKVLLGLQAYDSGTTSRASGAYEYIPQRGALYNGIVPMSVLEIVKLGSHGNTQSALEALQTAHIEDLQKRRFNDLSGGQQQRVIIAKALAAKADVLILDEPTAGIDERSQVNFYNLLKELQTKHITIIMVSHEVDTVLKLVTRVICLNRSIVYDGPPEHFEADTYLPRLHAAHHIQLHHYHKDRETLDD